MLQELFNLIKENGNDAVINNPAIPNEQNNAVLGDATHAVADGLQSEMAGGGLQNVLSLFNNNSSGGNGLLSNPIVSNIISSFTNKLTNNQHIASGEASNIASGLIPSVMSRLINKTNDSNDSSFSLSNIISSLSGGNSQTGNGFDIGNLLQSFTGNGAESNGNGHSGLSDLITKVTSGAQQQQQNKTQGGGLMDMIKSFI